MSLPIGVSEFVFEAVPWKFWHRENQVADFCSIIDIFLRLRAGLTFSEVVSTRTSGASRGRFSTASFVHPPAVIRSLVGEEVTAPDRTCPEVLRNVRHLFLRILARLLLSIALARN